jgi:hypothetical protein
MDIVEKKFFVCTVCGNTDIEYRVHCMHMERHIKETDEQIHNQKLFYYHTDKINEPTP